MELNEKQPGKRKLPVVLSTVFGLTAVVAIVALIILLTRGANFKTNYYSVTFVANTDDKHEGTIQSQGEKTFNHLTKIDAGYAPDSLSNYTFDYWCTDSSEGTKVEFPITLTKNEKFYAHWSKTAIDTYTVKFNTDGGSPIGDYSVLKGNSISRPESTREHFALQAWKDPDGNEVFKKQESGEYEVYTPTNNVTLTANWEQKEFNVLLELNGGTAPSGAQDIEVSNATHKGYPYVSKLDTAPIPTKDGFTFMGWYETSSFEGEQITFPYEPKKDNAFIYAKWEQSAESKTIIINANGGYLPKVGDEPTDPQTRTLTASYIPYAPTAYYDSTYKDKYELEGWFTADTGGTQISFPHTVQDGETIYAHWKQVRFAATIYANSTEEGTTERKLGGWDDLALVRYADIPTPQSGDMKLGSSGSSTDPLAYTLDHWDVYNLSEKKDEPIEPAGNLDITPLKYNAKINASWKHTKYTVTLHASTEEGAATKELKYQTTESLGTAGPSVPDAWVTQHSAFKGWNDKNGTPIDFKTFKLESDADFYMSEEVAMGRVFLHTAYAAGSTTYNGDNDWYYADKYSSLGPGFAARDLPNKAHYKKLGWTYTTDDSEPSTSKIIYSKGDTAYNEDPEIRPWPDGGVRPPAGGIAHLYPTYEQLQFEIKFNVGQGAIPCNSIWTKNKGADNKAYIDSADIPESTKTFSTFKGWALSEGGTALSKDELVLHPFTEDTTLYAIWETNAWTVNFNVLTGTQTYDKYAHIDTKLEGITQLSSGTLSDMTNYVSGKTEYDRTKAVIAGWTSEKPTSEDDTYNTSKISTSFTIGRDTDLYAIYNKTDVKITIDLNGASVGGSTETQTIETTSGTVTSAEVWKKVLEKKGTIVAPSNLPNFVGWSLNGSLIEYPYTLEASSELSIKMIWANTRQFMVTFNANNGDFYYKTAGVTKTTPLVSYTVDLDSEYWKDKSPTLANVYEKARTEIGGLDSSEYLLRDGYTLKANKFTMNGIEISDSYVINSSSGFTANWEAIASTGDWFKDSLSTIASYATSEDALKTQYKAAYEGTQANVDKSRTKAANSLLGLEVKIKIPTVSSTLSYHVRVIGVGQDSIVGSESTKKKACLTFEFVDCPVFGCYAPDGSGRDARYDKSTIRNSTLPYLLNTLPSSMTSLFKTVYKPYLTSESEKTSLKCTSQAIDETSLFILSAYEYGGSTSGSAYVENSNISSYKFAYKYYYSNTSVIGDGTSSKRYHYIPDTTTITPNWTRTPYNSKITKGLTDYDVCFLSGTSSKEGSILDYDPMSGYGIAPAFCIGVINS